MSALFTKLLIARWSIFESNFVLAKFIRGLMIVCCSELRGVCFLEVQIYAKINWGQVICQMKEKFQKYLAAGGSSRAQENERSKRFYRWSESVQTM